MEGNPHQGHRRRMLDKFGRFGVDAFADHELLEVLLYYTIRQGDTNPVAHALMQHFGSLHAVLEATADQLCEVEGVGPRTAEYLSLISASMRRYQTDRNRARNSVVRLNDPDKIGAFFVPRFAALHTESLCVAYVDSSCRLIRCDDQSRGSTSKVLLDPVAIPAAPLCATLPGLCSRITIRTVRLVLRARTLALHRCLSRGLLRSTSRWSITASLHRTATTRWRAAASSIS